MALLLLNGSIVACAGGGLAVTRDDADDADDA
jgi:hypothetical protein